MKYITLTILICLMFSGCATEGTVATPTASQQPEEFSPMEAILKAAERPEGITGVFKFKVLGAGRQDGWLYLNSEPDYRDQRCLTVGLMPQAARDFERMLGGDPVVALRGRVIRVTGTAQRTTIWFFVNGMKTDKYYYQTQIRLSDASAVRIIE